MTKKLILGTVQFGLDYGINNAMGRPSKEDAFRIIDYAIDRDICTLDTADAYGSALEILGEYSRLYRKNFTVNTKFRIDQTDIAQQLENAFSKLNTNAVNVYFYHNFEDFLYSPAYLDELTDLKKSGKIKQIGVSIYDNHEFKTACETEGIDVIQFPFNLLDNFNLRGEFINLAKLNGKILQARSVFLQGLLFKPIAEVPTNLTPLRPYLETINQIADSFQVSLEQLALQYALQQSAIDNVVIGVDNLEQLDRNVRLLSSRISGSAIELINRIIVEEEALLYPKNWN